MSLGSFTTGATVQFKFTSVSSGQPSALTPGTPGIQVWKDGSTTTLGTTEGVTLTTTFASIVGFNHVSVDLSADSTHYTAGGSYSAMLSTGATVDSVDVEGYVVAEWNIRAESHSSDLEKIIAGTTMLSTDADDLIATTTAIAATSTSIAAGTTMLSTDADDLIATSTAIAAGTTALQAGVFVTSMSSGALEDFFTVDAGTYAAASIGSVVKEIADNAGGSALTEAGIADAVWDENLSGHTTAGSAGTALGDIEAATTTLSTDIDDLIATSTAIAAGTTAIQAGTTSLSTSIADLQTSTTALMAGTTGLSTDIDDLQTTTTAIAAGTTSIQAGTTMLSTDADDLIASTTALMAGTTSLSTDIDDLQTTTTSIAAGTTAIQAGTTMLSTDADDLIASTTALMAGTTGLSTGQTDITAGTSRIETSTTAIQGAVASTGVLLHLDSVDAAALASDAITEIWSKTVTQLSTGLPATPTALEVLSFQHMSAYNEHVTTATSGYDIIHNAAGSTVFLAAVTLPDANSFRRARFST